MFCYFWQKELSHFSLFKTTVLHALSLFCSKRHTLEVYMSKNEPRSACSLRSKCRLTRAYSVWILDTLDWSVFVYIQQTSYEDDIFWTNLLAGQGLSNIALKSVSVLYGNFSEKFPIIHKHSNIIQALGRPFKLTDFLAALGLNSY